MHVKPLGEQISCRSLPVVLVWSGHREGKGSHFLWCTVVSHSLLRLLPGSPQPLWCSILGLLSGLLEMRALHRKGRMSGQICVSTALSLAAAAAQVRGASDTLVALSEKALSMLVLDVAVNEYDYSLAYMSLCINRGVLLPDTLNMFSFCFASHSLLHKWQCKCFLDNFVTPDLIKFIRCHAHAQARTRTCSKTFALRH